LKDSFAKQRKALINKETIMDKMYTIKIKVVSQKGTCKVDHKVGDEFKCDGVTPSGLCAYAFDAMFSFLSALMFGGEFFWTDNKDSIEVACPDAKNPVVFELRRKRPDN
jgi:uncharacterized repeat protein (TIGR04076 family)